VTAPREWDWEGFLALGEVEVEADFHCVTTWSRLDNLWTGVPARRVLEAAPPVAEATHVMVHCYGDYTTNLPLEDFSSDEVLFAHSHDGEPLAPEHGGPMRLIVPFRYAWKSAKWVNGLEYLVGDRRGFWEGYGYHNSADPWNEERYG
jgi:DMSO/TMAO reductase YedYZ molybdopterin-dependent catalytic subunit